jgi:lipoprotein NlpI
MRRILFLAILLIPTRVHAQAGDLDKAAEALRNKDAKEAVRLTSKLLADKPDSAAALALRAAAYEELEQYDKAIADVSRVIALDKKGAAGYQQRGLLQFKAGKIKESIDDFDQYIERKPVAKISHWQRGISYYYAGRYDDGRKQFEGYQDFDSNDVENAVWRFMCMVRKDGQFARARKEMLKIGDDKRVPMRQVYDLFKGDLKLDDVLAACKQGSPGPAQLSQRLFYAHLYVGIYHDLLGDKKAALQHLRKAADEHRIGHYMWDVARIHRDLLVRELKKQ